MSGYLILLGAPGAGKGTQAKRLAEQLGLVHISSGDLFREHFDNETDLGKLARGYIDRGCLVPDDVTIAMVRDRLGRPDAAAGAVLDGFPRTLPQAEALDEILAGFHGRVNAVIYIRVGEAVLVRRLTGRWMCRQSGHIYHEDFNPPRTPGVCDLDGSPLYQRSDDSEEVVRHRIQVYLGETSPLLAFYRERGLVREVDGDQSIEAVTEAVLKEMAS
jgi:adenylate kinase